MVLLYKLIINPIKNKLPMKHFFKNLFSCFALSRKSPEKPSETPENPKESLQNKLKEAVKADDVQKVYELLKDSANITGFNINFSMSYRAVDYVDNRYPYEYSVATSLLDEAKSEPMRRLLKHFGALTIKEQKQIEEDEAQKRIEEFKRQKEEKLKQKTDADNLFLDNVLS